MSAKHGIKIYFLITKPYGTGSRDSMSVNDHQKI